MVERETSGRKRKESEKRSRKVGGSRRKMIEQGRGEIATGGKYSRLEVERLRK